MVVHVDYYNKGYLKATDNFITEDAKGEEEEALNNNQVKEENYYNLLFFNNQPSSSWNPFEINYFLKS